MRGLRSVTCRCSTRCRDAPRGLTDRWRRRRPTAAVLRPLTRRPFARKRAPGPLLENACRIAVANHGFFSPYDGECCRPAAAYNAPPGTLELWERTPIRAGRGTATGR